MASPNLTYESVEALANSDEDWPGPRCGHTLTPIFTYNSQQLVLFGGTTIADGDSPFELRVEGVTNSLHCFHVLRRRWSRLNTCGDAPSPRACHAAAAVRTYLLIQGGINLDGPCDGDVFVLNIASNDLRWHRFNVEGVNPGPRYGHVMAIAAKRWLVIFGGSDGNAILSDIWALDVRRPSDGQTPQTWHRLNPYGNLPSGRMYASACTGQRGTFLLFGGTDSLGMPLGDAYGLIIFSLTQCRWVVNNASVAPSPRCQHSAVYDASRMHVIGGVGTGDNLVDGEATVSVLNTETGVWLEREVPETSASGSIRGLQYQLMRRCLHAAASIGSRIYVYGGLRSPDILLGDFLVSSQSRRPEPQVNTVISSMRRWSIGDLRGQPSV